MFIGLWQRTRLRLLQKLRVIEETLSVTDCQGPRCWRLGIVFYPVYIAARAA